MGAHIELSDLADRVSIPTLPEVVQKLNTMVENPKVGLDEIGELVSKDAAISAKVLRIANSAVYGLAEPATSVIEAAKIVGARTLRNIALQASIFDHYGDYAEIQEFDLMGVWKHAIFVGQMSQEIALRSRAVDMELTPDEFYTCGLLHDLGKVVLLESLGEQYLDVYRRANENGRASHLEEQEAFGFCHTDVGVLVARRWNLHERIGQVIQYHHGPRVEIERSPLVAVVAVADQLSYRLETGEFEKYARKLASVTTQLLQMTPKQFNEIVDWGVELMPLIEV